MRDTKKTENISIQLTGKQLTLLISGIFLISVCSFILGVLIIRITSPDDAVLNAGKNISNTLKIPAAAQVATVRNTIVDKIKTSIPVHKKKVTPEKITVKKDNLTFFKSLPDKNTIKTKPKQTAKITVKPATQKQKRTGRYTMQVASFSSQKDAIHLNNTLIQRGYDSYMTKINIPQKGLFFRVRIGSYPDRKKGLQQASRFFSSDGTRLSLGRPVIILR